MTHRTRVRRCTICNKRLTRTRKVCSKRCLLRLLEASRLTRRKQKEPPFASWPQEDK